MNDPARKLPSGDGVGTQVPREEIRKGLTAFQVMQAAGRGRWRQ